MMATAMHTSALATTREHRMLVTLLAACDPCGYVQAGASPASYSHLAPALADCLARPGCRSVDVLGMFPNDADAAAALQFARAALDWWARQREGIPRTGFPPVTL